MGLLSAAVLGALVVAVAIVVVCGRRLYYVEGGLRPFRIRRARPGEEARAQRSVLYLPEGAIVEVWGPAAGWQYSPIGLLSVLAFDRGSAWSIRRVMARHRVSWWRVVVGA